MERPFNAPDEFIHGFFKSAWSFWEALAPGNIAADGATANDEPDSADLSRKVAEMQMIYLQQQFALWTRMMTGATGARPEPVISPERGDRRFSAAEWRENPAYDLIKQNYLLNAKLIHDFVEAAQLNPREKHRLRFYAKQFVDSMSPTNFPATNPEVLKLALDSKGESLQHGVENMVHDLNKGGLTITDEEAFEVGKNVAVSKGGVVFENDLFQLIQYEPLTDQVASRPLVIVPPCINKFYILDLQPENSFVKFATESGQTVFLVSWRNPDENYAHITWDQYVEEGALKALDVALDISKADKVNAVGWCVGGTILSSALALMRTRKQNKVESVTLLTTMLDFREPGDLGVFVDEQGVRQREETIGKGGLYKGAELGFVFQTLRANDLIWPNVINNYLKGKSPEKFDLLYWNSDITNLPGPMYAWYLRNMYLENNLRVPNRLEMCGEKIDLGKVDMPSYVLATQEDHIVPWRSAFRTTGLFGGQSQFVLGASGHIAGVINPASKNKRSYFVNGDQSGEPQNWLETAEEKKGSWWNHWRAWLAPHVGKDVPARRKLGSNAYPVIEQAPGRYVKMKAQ